MPFLLTQIVLGKRESMSNSMKGFLFGIASSATFGLIPLFTLPLMAKGMVFDAILFYRFLFAALAIGGILIWRKESFRISVAELPVLIILGMLYSSSALFLFWGYGYLSSGIATTIHFLYPVFVTLIMIIFFHEKKSFWTFMAIVMALGGVALLSIGEGNGATISLKGITIVVISAISYALYITGVNKSRIQKMKGLKLTFYVLFSGCCIFFIISQIKGTFQYIPDSSSALNLLMLAIIPTVISNLTLVNAVKYIGSTLTAILGAMEPVTAVFVGIFVFSEPFTASLISGILLIISAVSIIILSRQLNKIALRLKSVLTIIFIKRHSEQS